MNGKEGRIFLGCAASKTEKLVDFQRFYAVWETDSLDWKGISADEITQRVLSGVKPGSIVLFHNAAEHTPEALAGIIEALQAEGYEFVPISELLLEGETTIDVNGMQKTVA